MGEKFAGRIVSAGTTVNNNTTATPFPILPGAKLTLVSDVAARVAIDFETCSATPGANYGVPLNATEKFPTVAGRATAALVNTSGGTMTALVSYLPNSGAGNLDVWVRSGQE